MLVLFVVLVLFFDEGILLFNFLGLVVDEGCVMFVVMLVIGMIFGFYFFLLLWLFKDLFLGLVLFFISVLVVVDDSLVDGGLVMFMMLFCGYFEFGFLMCFKMCIFLLFLWLFNLDGEVGLFDCMCFFCMGGEVIFFEMSVLVVDDMELSVMLGVVGLFFELLLVCSFGCSEVFIEGMVLDVIGLIFFLFFMVFLVCGEDMGFFLKFWFFVCFLF